MYPRNAASPEPIAIGPVVQISDGAVQSSGVTVRVKPIGVTEADGGGTTAYSTDGVVLYTPTQAETNYTSFVLIAKKTGCIPASVTVVTSARSVSGEVQVGGYASGQVPLQPTTAGRTLDVTATGAAGIDLANVENQGSTLNLTGTTIKTATDVETDTQDIQSRLPALLVDGRMVSLAQAVTDKSGYTLSQAFPSNFSILSIDTNGRVLLQPTQTGVTIPTVTSLTNSVTVGGYATGQAPLQPTVSGRTLDVTTTGAAGIDWGNVENQGAVVQLTNTLIDQTGSVSGPVGEISGVTFPTHFSNLVISANGHVTATVDSINNNAITAASIQANAFTSAKFAPDSITASALATDAVNEVRDAVAAITPIADLATMIVNDGTANARYSVSALQNGPSGAGGSTINVYPVSASTPERVAGTTITFYRDENRAVSVVTDFVLDALTLEFVVEDSEGTDLLVIADGSISRSNKTFTVTIGTTITATISNYRWSLRDLTSGSNSVIARGVLSVQEAASNG